MLYKYATYTVYLLYLDNLIFKCSTQSGSLYFKQIAPRSLLESNQLVFVFTVRKALDGEKYTFLTECGVDDSDFGVLRQTFVYSLAERGALHSTYSYEYVRLYIVRLAGLFALELASYMRVFSFFSSSFGKPEDFTRSGHL